MIPASVPVMVRLPAWRARLALMLLLGTFVLLGVRSAYLQSMKHGFLQEKGEARYSRVLEVPATRGRILDRQGEALAISTPVRSIWAIPEDFSATPAQLKTLGTLLGQDPREIERRVNEAARDFVYLKRLVPPEQAERIAALGIGGLHQHNEFRRYYPGGETTAHVVGFTGTGDAGQEGIELSQHRHLAGVAGSRRVIKDRLGRIVEDAGSIQSARDGEDLTLALDSRVQNIAFNALAAGVAASKARAGAIVALDVRSGEVLALANLPTFNPNNRSRLTGAQLRNRVMTDNFEPGSTLKPFTVALALEMGRITPKTVIPTAGNLTIANYTIHDVHPAASMSAAQVIQKSSNVGVAKIALSLPREEMHGMFRRLGFGTAPRLGFPGEAAGRVRDAKQWRPIEQATMAYGHGISVSLVQLARAYTVFARDGELVPLSLVKTRVPATGVRVFAPEVARALREMLEEAVQPGGTAPRARIMGWRVAGKTGTAHKLENGAYAAQKYVASFVGFAPVSEPRIVIAVMIDEPAPGKHYGGQAAAPVFAQVMQGALRLLAVPYDLPLEPVELPGEGDEARENT